MANELTYQSEFTGQQMDQRFTAVATLSAALEALTGVVAQKYVKPADGIPATDMDADVQAALAKALTAVQSLADYYTKAEVDALLAAINAQEYVDVASLPTASASTMGKIYLVGPDGSGYYSYYISSYDGSAYSWVGPLGTTEISLANYATKAELSQLDQEIGDMSDYQQEGYVDVPFTLVPDKYFKFSDLSEASSEGYEYTMISVTPGEKYSISGWNFNSNAPLCTARKAGTTTKARAITQSAAGALSGEYTVPEGYDTLYVNGRTGTAPVVIKKWTSVQKSLIEIVEENDAAQEAAVAAVDAKADGVKATIAPMTFSPLNDAYDFDDLTKWTAAEGAVLTEGETGVNMVCTYNGTKRPTLYQVVSGINAKNLAVVYLKAHVNTALAGTQFRVLLYLSGAETAVVSQYVTLADDTDIELVLPGAPAAGSSFSNPRLYIMVYLPTPAPEADTELCDVDIDYFAVFDDLHVTSIDAARAACADGKVFVPVTPTTIGRDWSGIGDSLTAQAKYVPGVMGALMLKSFQNIGTGGQKLSGSAGMCQDATINAISGDPWLITLMGGTNDWAQGVALGTDDSTDTDTYKGALNVAITKIVTAHPAARLVVMGPPYAEIESRITTHNWPNAWTNLLGLTVRDYAQAAEDVCAKRGIPCVNFGKLTGWNHDNLATFMQEASVHPNDAGGERMSAVLAGFLRGILPTRIDAI